MRANVPIRMVLLVVVVLLVAVAGFLLLQQGQSWQERSARAEITKHESPPSGWKGIELGMTRQAVADMFVKTGTVWPSIQKPGMAPTVWASHVDLSLNDEPPGTMSLRFSDNLRWDYGRHPQTSADVVDAESLIGAFDPKAEVTGIMWMVDRSDYDLENETVPVEVLQELGAPHSQNPDITGHGQVYLWDWPEVKAYYTTVDGRLSIQNADVAGT